MVDMNILNSEEVKWLNDYHAEVLAKVGPHLSGKTLEWLKKETQPI